MPPPPPAAPALSALPVPWPLTLRLSLQDAERVRRLVLAVPDAKGSPFLSPTDAMRLALEIAAQVAETGLLDRFRTRRPVVDVGPPMEVYEATRAWLERAGEEMRARAAKAARKRR